MGARPRILPADPRAEYLRHQVEIDQAVRRVLEGGRYILGSEVEGFEEEFAAYLGIPHAVGVASGTDALMLALKAVGIGTGDTVVTVSHTTTATVAAIEMAGATPALVDIEADGFTMDPQRLDQAVEALLSRGVRPRAILVVHLYGHPAAMPAILTVARRHGLALIEDCAQAHGARLAGTMMGTWGDVAAFSFYPTKNLGALGDGGAVVTADGALARSVRELREYGWKERYISDRAGVNSRLDELQAAILRVKLTHLKEANAARVDIARTYHRRLADSGLRLPSAAAGGEPVYHQYVVRTPRRDALRAFLAEHGIGTMIHYPAAIHQQPAYGDRLEVFGGIERTERAVAEIVSLPMHPSLSTPEVDEVVESIEVWAGQQAAG